MVIIQINTLLRKIAVSHSLDIRDLARLNRCSRRLQEATSCLLYQRCTLDVRRNKVCVAFTALDALATPGNKKRAFVEELVFVGMTRRGCWDLARDEKLMSIVWTKIIAALENLENLRKFQWTFIGNPPHHTVVKKLANMKSLRSLNIGFERDNEEKTFLPRESWGIKQPYLSVPEGLYSLGISVNSHVTWASETIIGYLRDLLCASPHMKILRSTPEIFGHLFTSPDIVWKKGNTPPSIPVTLELKLFRNHHSLNVRVAEFLFKEPGNPIVNLKQLENLIVDDAFSESWAGLFPRSGPLKTLRCLDRVGYMWGDDHSEMQPFLQSRQQLEEITIMRCGLVAPDGWSKYLLNTAQNLKKLHICEGLTPREIENWPEVFLNLQALTFKAPELDTWGKPVRELTQLLQTLAKLPSLRVLRFAIAYPSDTPGETELLNLQTVETVDAAFGTDQWGKLKFVCTMYRRHGTNWMAACERRKDGSWKKPVHVEGRFLFVERMWLGSSLSLAELDEWDEWLDARL